MLSSSHSKIHDPRVTGVSYDPRAADQGQESAKHEGSDPLTGPD
jgi:hypothetical protein